METIEDLQRLVETVGTSGYLVRLIETAGTSRDHWRRTETSRDWERLREVIGDLWRLVGTKRVQGD